MRRFFAALYIVALLVAGCQSGSKRNTSGDYREDQATRVTTEDAQRKTQAKKRPLDTRQRDGQNVIDQPR